MRDAADKATLDLFAEQLQQEVEANRSAPPLKSGWRAHWQPWYENKLEQKNEVKPHFADSSREFLKGEKYENWKRQHSDAAESFELTKCFEKNYGKCK